MSKEGCHNLRKGLARLVKITNERRDNQVTKRSATRRVHRCKDERKDTLVATKVGDTRCMG